MRKVLVTGGAGFIGSNLIRHLLKRHDYQIVNLDKLTYAGNLENLRDLEGDTRYRFIHGDICDPAAVEDAMEDVWAVVNLAAETHVDRSLFDASPFIETDVHGSFIVLEAARRTGVERFLHVSTDEVYGPRFPDDPARETDALLPANPYAASKAGGELQVLAYFRAYSFPVVVARSANNVGPWQHPEKAVPLFISNALHDLPLPIYGDGSQVRDRLFVEDHCEALDLLLHDGRPGEAYNIFAGNERTNLEVAEAILEILGKPRTLIRFVKDRSIHDARYTLDPAKTMALGWQVHHDFATTMDLTVSWYRDHRDWWEKVRAGEYRSYYERQYGDRLRDAKPFKD